MVQTAAHLADHVIRPVPVRQSVISVPKRLRGMLADRPAAVAALTKIFLDEIERSGQPLEVGGNPLQRCRQRAGNGGGNAGGGLDPAGHALIMVAPPAAWRRGPQSCEPAHIEPEVRKREKARMASPA